MTCSILVLIALIPVGQSAPGGAPAGLASRIWEITDAVIEHHIDAPARQQMILEALKSLHRAARVPVPPGLARHVSKITTPEELAPVLDVAWPLVPPQRRPKPGAELGPGNPLIDALLEAVPGGARLLSARDLAVEEQFAGNRYVGLQIALGMNQKEKRPEVNEVLEGGPADKAGLKKGDLIDEIDGVTTTGMDVRETIERLRGAEGTSVTIRVRHPQSSGSSVLTITRGVLPRTTVKGFRNRPDGSMDLLIPGPERIGYVQFEQVLGSTPQELRALARRLEDEAARALILDFRPVAHGRVDLHATVLLADCLLEGGTIGRVRSTDRVDTYSAEPDALFRDQPLFVLVDNDTPAVAEWLAAALQDNNRAMVVAPAQGRASRGSRPPLRIPPAVAPMLARRAYVESAVSIGDGEWSIEMTTGQLERGDGRPLGRAAREEGGSLVADIPVSTASPGRARAPESDPLVRGDPVLAEALRQLRVVLRAY
jgi:carboxyl-terminal processing protease